MLLSIRTASCPLIRADGAPVLVSAFGTPTPPPNGEVLTTDRTGTAGFNTNTSASGGDYTGFNGTSAAAPMVTGIVALMLDANENLGWRDVQTILAYSARHVGSAIGGSVAGAERFPGSSTVRRTGTATGCTSATTTDTASSTLTRRCASPRRGRVRRKVRVENWS